jgi:hypothetical protein
MVLAIGVAVHVWRVRKDGGIYIPPEERAQAVRPPEPGARNEEARR